MASLGTSNNLYFFFLLLVSFCFLISFSTNAQEFDRFYSIYSFGDSGSLVSSHLAEILSLPSPLPYTNKEAEFESGLSFMTPGSTIMTPFFFAKNGISPPPESHQSQINNFMNHFYKDCFNFRDCSRNKVLQKAIIFMDQPGFNDYKSALLHGKLSTVEVSKFVPEIVEAIKINIERLIHEAGTKHFLVSGILPMGCLPGFRILDTDSSRSNSYKCHKGLNLFSRLHNDHLWQVLQELRLKYPQVEIVYADYYKAFMALLRNHAVVGFKTKTLMKACCDLVGFKTKMLMKACCDPMKQCGVEGVEACSDRASHVHWDGFTLTPEASKNLIDTLLNKKGFVFPEFKFAVDQAAAVGRHHSKIYTLFRDSLRHLIAA